MRLNNSFMLGMEDNFMTKKFNKPELPFLVIGYFKSDESVKWIWFKTEEEANEWIDGYKRDFPDDFVVAEFIEVESRMDLLN